MTPGVASPIAAQNAPSHIADMRDRDAVTLVIEVINALSSWVRHLLAGAPAARLENTDGGAPIETLDELSRVLGMTRLPW